MLKDTTYILLSRASNVVFQILLAVTVSRALGPAGFGVYTYLLSVLLTASGIANFGLDTWLVREIIRDPERKKDHLSRTLTLKLFTSLAALLLVMGVFIVIPLGDGNYTLLIILMTAQTFEVLAQALWFYANGSGRVDYHAGLWALSNVLKSVLGIAGVLFFQNLLALISSLALARLITFILSLMVIRVPFGPVRLSWEFREIQILFYKAVPLAVGGILSLLFFRLDILILKLFASDQAVGWFGAAYKFVEVASLFPQSVILVLFPALVKSFSIEKQEHWKTSFRMITQMALIGLGGSVLIAAFPQEFIRLIYGAAFEPAAFPLRILSVTIWFYFINTSLSIVLISIGLEKRNTLFFGWAIFIKAGANWCLILWLGFTGAAWAAVVGEVFLFILLAREICSVKQQNLQG